MQDQNSPPIDELNLSLRSYNCLRRSGLHTVAQVAALSDEELLSIRNLGRSALIDIRKKLAAYLSEHPLPEITEEIVESKPMEAPPAIELSLSESPSPSPDPTPLGVLGLSGRPHFALMQAGITTIGQLAAMSREQIREVRNVSEKGLTEIEEKLAAYLAEHPLPDEAEEGPSEPEAQVAEPLPPQPPSPSPDPTSLGVLGLSIRPYNVLRRAGITTIGQLAAMSREQIREVRNVGKKSLAEIEDKLEAYLAVHPLPTKPAPPTEEPKPPLATQPAPSTKESKPPLPSPPLADPEVLNSVREKGIPLDEISLERLALPESLRSLLRKANVETIGELALQPRKKWRRQVNIIQRLNRYLVWLVEQDETAWDNEVAGRDISPLHRLELAETSLEDLAGKWLSVLDSRENQVIRWRYGVDSEELTLEEVGERLGITRERVRQIQGRARYVLSRAIIRPLSALLVYLVEQAGGLMSEAQVEAALRRELVIGDVDPVGVARLLFDLHDGFKRIREVQVWGLTRFPLDQMPAINRRLAEVLEKAYVPLTSDKVVTRFKETRSYQNHRDALDNAFIVACLRTHPRIEIGKDGLCSLEKWSRHRLNEMILALREIGEPVHYSVIADKVNALLPPEQQTAPRNVHAELSRRTDLFVRVGRGIFGLKEWELPDDGSLANAACRVLTDAGHPLYVEAIIDRVLETWRVGRSSVHAAILNDDRFYRAAPATFGLLEWEIERLDEAQPVLNVCPPPLPDRRGERNTFFESVLVARDLLRERPTTAAFLGAMLRWVGTDEAKSERYLQNVLNAYYVVGLLPYTVYRRAADAPLCSTLPETDDLQALRRSCLDCMMERLARMPEFIALLAARQPCTATELTSEFHIDIYALRTARDEVLNRLRILKSLGVVSAARARYRLTHLGEAEVAEVRYSLSTPHLTSITDGISSDVSTDADIGWLDAAL